MRIICPKCRKRITVSNDIAPQDGWARCTDCGVFFRLPDIQRKPLPLLPSSQIVRTEDSLLIEQKKSKGCLVLLQLLILLPLLIGGFLAFWKYDFTVSFITLLGGIFFGFLTLALGIAFLVIGIEIFSPHKSVLILRDQLVIMKRWFGKRWEKEYPIEEVSPVHVLKSDGELLEDFELYLSVDNRQYHFCEYGVDSVFWLAAEIDSFLFGEQGDSNTPLDENNRQNDSFEAFEKFVQEYKLDCVCPDTVASAKLLNLVYLYRYGRLPFGSYGDCVILHCPQCRHVIAPEQTAFPGDHGNRCPHCSQSFTLEEAIPHYYLFQDHKLQTSSPVLPYDSRFDVRFKGHTTIIRMPLRENKFGCRFSSLTIIMEPEKTTFQKKCYGMTRTIETKSILSIRKLDWRFRKKSFFPKTSKSCFPMEVECLADVIGQRRIVEIPCFTAFEQDWLYDKLVTQKR